MLSESDSIPLELTDYLPSTRHQSRGRTERVVMGASRKVGAPRTGEVKDHDDVNDAHSSLPHPRVSLCVYVCV